MRAAGATRAGVLAIAAVAVLAACDAPEAEPAGQDVPAGQLGEGLASPEALGALGALIHVQPDNAEAILARAGITPEQFEEEVRRVSADPELSARYTEAFEAALPEGMAVEKGTAAG